MGIGTALILAATSAASTDTIPYDRGLITSASAKNAITTEARVLFVYDSQFAVNHPDPAARLQQYIDYTNQAFVNSNIAFSLSIGGMIERNITNVTGNEIPVLESLIKRHGQFGRLSASTGSHFITLITSDDPINVCGIAVGPGPSPATSALASIVYDQCGFRTFAHEIGHNMGAGHTAPDCGGAAFPYSCAHDFDNGEATIVSNSSNNRIPYYSNPLIECGIHASCGTADADNARAFAQSGPNLVANSIPFVSFEGPLSGATQTPLSVTTTRTGLFGRELTLQLEDSLGTVYETTTSTLVSFENTLDDPSDTSTILLDADPGTYTLVAYPPHNPSLRFTAPITITPQEPPTIQNIVTLTDFELTAQFDYDSDTPLTARIDMNPGRSTSSEFPASANGLGDITARPRCGEPVDFDITVSNATGGTEILSGTYDESPCSLPLLISSQPLPTGVRLLVQNTGVWPLDLLTTVTSQTGTSYTDSTSIMETNAFELTLDLTFPISRLKDGETHTVELTFITDIGEKTDPMSPTFIAEIPQHIFSSSFE